MPEFRHLDTQVLLRGDRRRGLVEATTTYGTAHGILARMSGTSP